MDDFDSGFDRKVDCVQDLPRGRDNFRSGPSNANTMKQGMPFLVKSGNHNKTQKWGLGQALRGSPLGHLLPKQGFVARTTANRKVSVVLKAKKSDERG